MRNLCIVDARCTQWWPHSLIFDFRLRIYVFQPLPIWRRRFYRHLVLFSLRHTVKSISSPVQNRESWFRIVSLNYFGPGRRIGRLPNKVPERAKAHCIVRSLFPAVNATVNFLTNIVLSFAFFFLSLFSFFFFLFRFRGPYGLRINLCKVNVAVSATSGVSFWFEYKTRADFDMIRRGRRNERMPISGRKFEGFRKAIKISQISRINC